MAQQSTVLSSSPQRPTETRRQLERRRTTNLGDPARTADWLTRTLGDWLLQRLQRLCWGQLEIVDGTDHDRFGASEPTSPSSHLRVLRPQFYRQVIFGGDLGAAESYLRGQWQTDDLVPLFRLLIRNQATLQRSAAASPGCFNPRRRSSVG